jgi:hypothetical protein
MQRWTSRPLRVSRDPSAPWRRADLAFEDLHHDGPSFRVLLYLDNPDADERSGRDVGAGYAGEFPVFAHGDCWGDAGHCDAHRAPVSAFDRRSMPALTPIGISVEITEALQRAGTADQVTVTALAFSTDENQTEILRFGRLHLLTYD